MKKRFIFILSLILVSIFVISGCAANEGGNYDRGNGYAPEYENSEILDSNSDIAERKIIYTANITLECDNIDETVKLIRSTLSREDWTENETISLTSARMVVRVKSENLNDFLETISEGSAVHSRNVSSVDVSLDYTNKQLKIAALTAEYDRVIELIDNANSQGELLSLNARLTTLYHEISQLEKAINSLDSSIEFSTVTIYLSQAYVAPAKETVGFGAQFVNVIKGSFKALGTFFRYVIIVITAVLPFALALAPIVVLIIFLMKRHNKKIDAKIKADKEKRRKEKESFENKIDNMLE